MSATTEFRRWSNEDLSRAMNMAATGNVEVALGDEQVNHARSQLVFALLKAMREDGLFVRSDEIVVNEWPGENEGTLQLHASWHPTVKTVEFWGGIRDGEQVELDNVGAPAAWQDASGNVVYRLGGWCERRRLWIYVVPKI